MRSVHVVPCLGVLGLGAREEEKATAWAVGLLTGEQASRQACATLGLCPLGRLGLGGLGFMFGLSCGAGLWAVGSCDTT